MCTQLSARSQAVPGCPPGAPQLPARMINEYTYCPRLVYLGRKIICRKLRPPLMPTVPMFTLPNHDQVVDTCREYGIGRLEVFGASVRTPASARDVDLLVDEQR